MLPLKEVAPSNMAIISVTPASTGTSVAGTERLAHPLKATDIDVQAFVHH